LELKYSDKYLNLKEITLESRILCNEGPFDLCISPSIVTALYVRRIQWAGHFFSGGKQDTGYGLILAPIVGWTTSYLTMTHQLERLLNVEWL
jgi:hypothetical protein